MGGGGGSQTVRGGSDEESCLEAVRTTIPLYLGTGKKKANSVEGIPMLPITENSFE
jgi:hypothetical protein